MPIQNLHSVLYVDDDPDICAVVEATLRMIGDLDVRTASSGQIAIDLACDERPDLILMDVMMPGLDGPSTLKVMHDCEAICDVPVIFLTAKVMPTEVTQFLTQGAIGVIGKPFDPTRLCSEIVTLWQKTGRGRAVGSTSSTESHEVVAQVSSLSGRFLERAQRDVGRLRQLLERLRNGDDSSLRQLERLSHSIHGAAAMFGFSEVSDCGAALEDLAEELMSGTPVGAPSEPAALRRLAVWIDRFAEEVEAAGITQAGVVRCAPPARQAISPR